VWSYRNPVDVRFGRGAFAKTAELLAGRDYALVTYPDAYFRSLSADLEAKAGKPLIVVDDIAPNPDIELLERQTARFAGLAKQPEVIVALGGGSVIDSAKVFAAAPGDFARMDAFLKKRTGPQTLSPVALIAIPTTAGTGSEVTCWGTVWDGGNGVKRSLAHPGLYPQYAIVDPDLMLGKPRDRPSDRARRAVAFVGKPLEQERQSGFHGACGAGRAHDHLDLAAAGKRSAQRQSARKDGPRLDVGRLRLFQHQDGDRAFVILSDHVAPRRAARHRLFLLAAIIIRGVSDKGGICAEGLQAIFGSDHEGASKQLAATLEKLGVSTDYRSYELPREFRELITQAFDGERGQNFIGGKEELLAAAGFEELRARLSHN
jgi:alcohol dehydrogenase